MTTQPHPCIAGGFAPPEDLFLYRDRTIALLRRYFRMVLDLGRLPSLLGRELFFRARVTSYRRSTLEDAVIFVHDIERCFDALDKLPQLLIARIVLQNYTHEEAALLLRCTPRTVRRMFPEAVDELTAMFLDRGILRLLPKHQEACQ